MFLKNYIITDGSSLKLWTFANSICIYNHVVRLDLICCVKLLSKFAFKLNLIKLILSLRERIKIYEKAFLFEKIPFWQLQFDVIFSV